MKIVQIEGFFHPDAGYQINIISKYMVKAGHEVTIITGQLDNVNTPTVSFFGKDNIDQKDKRYQKKYNVKIIRVPVKRIISNRAQFSKDIYAVIKRENPSIVYVHGNDSLFGMQYLRRYKRLGYPLIMDSHMLAMASKNKLGRYFHKFYMVFFTPIIIKNGIRVIRTQDDSYVKDEFGIPLKLAPWISVGSDTMLFHPDAVNRMMFREKNHIDKDAFIVLYAGKLDDSKGGLILAEGILKKIDTRKKLVFCIVGKTVGSYGESVENTFKKSDNIIIRFPTQKYEELAEFYQAADMAVFPRQCSLSFYDVQASGLPVLFEDDSVNESRINNENAMTFASDNTDDFRKRLTQMINMDEERFEHMKKASVDYVLNGFDYKEITDRYLELIEKEMKRQKKKLRKR